MRKHVLILLLLSVTIFAACAQNRKTAKKKAPPAAPAKTGYALRGLTSVAMRRGACFGRCPEYVITINSDGTAEYNGTRNADPLGVYQKNIGTAAAQSLLAEFMLNRADTCSELYHAHIADLPGLHYTLTINGRKKLINNASFGPPYLITLSEQMDALGKVDGSWKKIRDNVKED